MFDRSEQIRLAKERVEDCFYICNMEMVLGDPALFAFAEAMYDEAMQELEDLLAIGPATAQYISDLEAVFDG